MAKGRKVQDLCHRRFLKFNGKIEEWLDKNYSIINTIRNSGKTNLWKKEKNILLNRTCVHDNKKKSTIH